MKKILIIFLLFTSCSLWKTGETRKEDDKKITDNNTILFLVMNIRKDSTMTKPVVKLVSKTISNGKIKNMSETDIYSANH